MGAIYIGKKLGPGGFAKEVVLKQLLPEYTSRPEFRDLFFREAKISATLDHANIVHTFDLVESDQSLFIVMEYVRGADLRTIIRRARHRRRELSPPAAIHIALEILAGLSYAHARRDATGKSLDIIHRDVSPSNIICSAQGTAKLSDFGIAKASTYSSVFYRVRGKVGYMSPEQARSQEIDHRCDLFSLSVCLYESLSGERLFVGDLNTPADEVYGIQILPVSRKRHGLPRLLDDVLSRALAPDIDDRYQSAADLAEALRTVAHKNGLAFSAPELASHLQDILGDDPERWLRDEPAAAATDPLPIPVDGSALVGKEAASIGIVNDIPEDEPGRSVLSPRVVSGGKDFDLESMLNDEATRPGGEDQHEDRREDRRGGQREDRRDERRPPAAPALAPRNEVRARRVATPPPVWTRDSGPFALATPHPTTAVPDRVAASTPASDAVAFSSRAASGLAGVRPAPPALPARRPLPRATARGPAAPPPFQPTSRASAPPPPPPFPRVAAEPRGAPTADGIAEPTPVPAVAVVVGSEEPSGGFQIDEGLTPPPPAAGHRPLMGIAPAGRSPPASYPVPAFEPPVVVAPSMLNPPQTMDFSGAVTALLPEKKGGPPGWLATMLILVATLGGAALAYRVTRSQVAAAREVEPLRGKRPQRAAAAAEHAASPLPSDRAEAVSPSPAPGADVAHSDKAEAKAGRPAAREADTEIPLDAPAVGKAAGPKADRTSNVAAPARPNRGAKAAHKNRHVVGGSNRSRGKH